MISPKNTKAFTLIELLTVIAIIAVLMGLLFPAIGSVKETARKTQAKNDEMQIVNAIKAYYTEYGKYPVKSSSSSGDAPEIGDGDEQNKLFDVLRVPSISNSNVTEFNPRQIVFIEVPFAKDPDKAPKSGIGGNGRFYDPWGSCYRITIDTDYSNTVKNPYTSGAGVGADINTGVIVWSYGKDKKIGKNGSPNFSGSDDVASWQ